MDKKQPKVKKASTKAKGFTISRKLGLSYFILFILILLGGAAGLNSTYTLNKTLTFIAGDGWSAADGAMELEVHAERQIIATMGAVIYPMEYSKYRKIYEKAKEKALAARTEMFETGLFSATQKQELEKIQATFNNVSVAVLSMMDDGDYTTEELNAQLSKLERSQNDLLEYMGVMEEYADNIIEGEQKNIGKVVAFAFFSVLLMLAIGVGVAFIAYIANVRSIVTPLKKTVNMLRDISQGEGDLTIRMPVKGNDEIAQLSGWFNAFVEKTQQMVQSIMGSTAQLAAAAEEMSAITSETQEQVTQQRYETDAVAAAMNQMSATTNEVARNANEAAAAAETANDNAVQGQGEVSETMNSIQQLVRGVEGASGAITELAKDSDSIGTVLEVIKDIAEQTNLLALNAAIEAARAGEQGRGFAVVADEVRTLASRTRESTEEIEQMVERFRNASDNAVKAMAEGSKAASRSVEQAEHAKQALSKITESVRTILDLNAMIATASEQQGVMSEEVHRNITTINTVAIETEQGAIQTARSSGDLASLAAQLQQVVNQFKV